MDSGPGTRDLGPKAPFGTRADSFRQALTFCRYTIGLDFVEQPLSSGRVSGAAAQSFARKRITVQRAALKVHLVARLREHNMLRICARHHHTAIRS